MKKTSLSGAYAQMQEAKPVLLADQPEKRAGPAKPWHRESEVAVPTSDLSYLEDILQLEKDLMNSAAKPKRKKFFQC